MTFFAGAGVPVVLVGLVYAAGARRRADCGRPVSGLRHTAFATGLTLLFLSLQWPFAQWAHQLFFVHQIGIMIARIMAPMLIALSHPAGLLIAGLPRPARTRWLKPIVSAAPVRKIWHLIGQPPVSLGLYLAMLLVWDIPAAQSAALNHPAVGLLMHLSLLLVGLLFWSAIFERRPAPHGIAHGKRLMMIWIAILCQVGLGVYFMVKTSVLYPAYGATERLAMLAPLADERRGGFFIWVPSALLSLFALIVVIDLWARHETRMDIKRTRWSPSNSAILLYPTTAREMRAMTRVKNRRLAIGMAAFALIVFTSICGFATGAHRLSRRENLRLYALSHR
jgi:putative membrane protein